MLKIKIIFLAAFCLFNTASYAEEVVNKFGTVEQTQTHTGKLAIYWKRIGPEPKDKVIAFIFYPTSKYKSIDLSTKLFESDLWAECTKGEIASYRKMTQHERAELTKQLANKYFGKLPESFTATQEGMLYREGTVTINYISEDGAADSYWLSANMLSFEPTNGKVIKTATPPVKLTGPERPWFADQDVYRVSVKDGSANIRSEPSTKGKVLGQLVNGKRVGKIQTTATGWFSVADPELADNWDSFSAEQGYVHSSQVTIDPVYYYGSNKAQGCIDGGNAYCNVYDFGADYDDFNLHEKPSSAAVIINKLPPATPLITINKTANSDWLAVEALVDKQKVKGFVLAKQVTFNKMGVVDNNKPVMLYVQPEEKANVMATLTDDNIKLTTIKPTADKDWFYVEILEHEPIYKGYLKREAIKFN